MDGEQLLQVLKKHVAPFCNVLGVFPKDKLPPRNSITRYPACCIMNTDKAGQPGEHWVAYWFDSSNACEFFDSYGLAPSAFGFSHTCTHYNTKCIQSYDSNVCGHYCLYYLIRKSRGHSLHYITLPFDSSTPLWNDSQVLKSMSNYLTCMYECSSCAQVCISRNCSLSRKNACYHRSI